jgi:hypothetical protein
MNQCRIALALLIAGAQVSAQEHMTGMFRISQTPIEVMGEQAALALDEKVPADEPLRWQVFVPETYNEARPPGVFVFLDPKGWGGLPDQWRSVITDHNLIWVGPNKNEPRQSMEKQIWHATMGLRAIEQQYAIDLNRVYIGSARETALASLNTQLSGNDFRGAIYMRGSVMWKTLPPDRLEMLQRKRHVFITGANDNAKARIRADYNSYKEAGINNAKLIFDTKRIGQLPDPDHMIEAIRYLDGN